MSVEPINYLSIKVYKIIHNYIFYKGNICTFCSEYSPNLQVFSSSQHIKWNLNSNSVALGFYTLWESEVMNSGSDNQALVQKRQTHCEWISLLLQRDAKLNTFFITASSWPQRCSAEEKFEIHVGWSVGKITPATSSQWQRKLLEDPSCLLCAVHYIKEKVNFTS